MRQISYSRPADARTEALIADLFALGRIGYVALGVGQDVLMRLAPGFETPISCESNFYEELIVNPTLIALARQRGELNCGGLRYVAVGYGGFVQFVAPMRGGHVSLGVSETRDCKQLAIEVAGVLRRHRRTPLPARARSASVAAYAGAAPVPAV